MRLRCGKRSSLPSQFEIRFCSFTRNRSYIRPVKRHTNGRFPDKIPAGRMTQLGPNPGRHRPRTHGDPLRLFANVC